MRFSTALDGSLPVLWLHMAQTICKKSVTQETSLFGFAYGTERNHAFPLLTARMLHERTYRASESASVNTENDCPAPKIVTHTLGVVSSRIVCITQDNESVACVGSKPFRRLEFPCLSGNSRHDEH